MINLIGKSTSFITILEKLDKISNLDIPILIEGDAGVGKDTLVQYIREKYFIDSPFIKFHCQDLEKELSYVPKFKTEEIEKKSTKSQKEFYLKGLIYLDEFHLLDKNFQSVLLRILETNQYNIDTKTTVYFPPKIYVSSKIQIAELYNEKLLDERLYYKLSSVKIVIPSLIDRKEDIPILIRHFIEKMNQKYQKNVRGVNDDMYRFLLAHNWKGNIYEMESFLEGIIALISTDVLEMKHLPSHFHRDIEKIQPSKLSITVGTKLADYEKAIILTNMEYTNQNRVKTAKILGISERTLYRKLNKYKKEKKNKR